jgi:hypothetical protein
MFPDDFEFFQIPFKRFISIIYIHTFLVIIIYICLFVYSSHSVSAGDYSETYPAYIRDCYYRLILEILLIDFKKFDNIYKLVVLGSPGIGKSSLLFLFIRVLLEMNVEVWIAAFVFILNVVLLIEHLSYFKKLLYKICEKR